MARQAGKALLLVLLAIGVVATLAPSAGATAFLYIRDTTTGDEKYIFDGSADDLNPDAGIVAWQGYLSANWDFNLEAGISYPAQGSSTSPDMHFTSMNHSTSSGGTIWVGFYDNFDYTGPMHFDIGGAADEGGSVEFLGWKKDSGGIETIYFNPVFLSGGAFSDELTTNVDLALLDLFFGISAWITHEGAGTTSLDAIATAAPVPEPGTMMLLGSGLVGLAGWGRKKFRR